MINPADGAGSVIEVVKDSDSLPVSLLGAVDQSLAQNLVEFHEYTPVADESTVNSIGGNQSSPNEEVSTGDASQDEAVIGAGEAVEVKLPEPGALTQDLVLDTIPIDELPDNLINAVSEEVISIVEAIPDYTPIIDVAKEEIAAQLNLSDSEAVLVPGEVLSAQDDESGAGPEDITLSISSPQSLDFLPDSLDIFSDSVVSEILETAQVFTPVTVAEADAAEAQQIASEGDTVSLMEAVIEDISAGAVQGILKTANETGADIRFSIN